MQISFYLSENRRGFSTHTRTINALLRKWHGDYSFVRMEVTGSLRVHCMQWYFLLTNRPEMGSAIFEMCMISAFILSSFESE